MGGIEVDRSGATVKYIFHGDVDITGAFDGGDVKQIPLEFGMKGVMPTPAYVLGMNDEIVAGLTANDATERAIGNNHVRIIVNSITGSDTMTVTGDSTSEASGVPTIGDTEVITIDATGSYQTDKKFWRITSIVFGGSISAINYDIYRLGYFDNSNTDFRVIGYRFEITPTSATLVDFLVHVHKVQDDGSGKMTLVDMDDIAVSGTTPFVVDTKRGTRGYTGGQIFKVGIPTVMKQTDFETYFSSDENICESASKAEGLIVDFNWDNVDYVTGFIYYKTGTGL
jgi:hypothetical protein